MVATLLLAATNTWVDDMRQIIALITGLLGLISAGVGVFFAIKNWVKAQKDKKASEIWQMIMEFADAAMKEAERSGQSGADKKQTVINAVKAACKSVGLDIDAFLDQLSAYIDQTIVFVNDMKKKDHDCIGEWQTSLEPTCTTEGKKELKCTICGVVSTETIPATGHISVFRDGQEPTCTEAGKTAEEYCETCGTVLTVAKTISPKGHKYKYVPETQATCTHVGEKAHYVCETCGAYFADTEAKEPIEDPQTLIVPQLEHTKVLVKGYAADCEKDGLTDGYKCEVCDTVLEEQKPIPRYHVFKGKHYAHQVGLETYEDREEFTHFGNWDYHKQTTEDVGQAAFKCEKCGGTILINIHGVNSKKA